MSNNVIKGGSDADQNARLSVREAPSPNGTNGPDLTRRRLIRGAAAAAPVILTLRSGASLAQVSASYATPWRSGFIPSDQCAGPAVGGQTERFEVFDVQVAQPAPSSGRCPQGWNGFDLDGAPNGKDEVCCQPGVLNEYVLVTASSATSLSGANLAI